MIKDYYQRELKKIKQLSKEFSLNNPTLAPLLREQNNDPDVERLLEGVAYLTSQIQLKMDRQLPDLIDELTELFFPQYLRPIPGSAILQFIPKKKLADRLLIKQNTEIASIPIDGTSCVFRTANDIIVEPVTINTIRYTETPQGNASIDIVCDLCGISLDNWSSNSLKFFINQPFNQACDTYYLLLHHLKEIVVSAESSPPLTLPPNMLQPCGFKDTDTLYPAKHTSNPAYQLIQEYLNQPKKFLFLELTGLKQWIHRSNTQQFTISLIINQVPSWFSDIQAQDFVLHAVPILNIFKHDAEPIYLNHKKFEYPIIPSGNNPNITIYEIKKITGYRQYAKQQIDYVHALDFDKHRKKNQYYTLHSRPSAVKDNKEWMLGFIYDFNDEIPSDETISVDLLCSNGNLASLLDIGDISRITDSSPENVTFSNITVPTSYIEPAFDDNRIWHFQSLLSLNFLKLMNKDNLIKIITLFLHEQGENRRINVSRLQGIVSIKPQSTRRLYRRSMIVGTKISMVCDPEYYGSPGDMYLFGCILNEFFAINAPFNTFTHFEMINVKTKEIWEWTPRLSNPDNI
ncbi:type VI secretion system baseplate subunit TssF [Legionella spiritensis]|uniref:Type VI secretion protein n=1 Tax=Legionella spiritensis TaxID=452 RepID=A0A0W0Z9F2_LEGSP|nr:type VI secretion system baseplate subunit TssF [Legionella spiritensis]KTD65739.1 hypothetical protein Lspi_0451 [Legionella spiritensis]SNV42792.1 Uncharacterized protein conserved in bacteria [Legionella spiritensis]VEG90604.1 Uncharacterized protein conserved in bacteria [Legionella spiritensis]